MEVSTDGVSPADAVPNLPESRCLKFPSGFYCVAPAGRYAIEVQSPDLTQSHQLVAAHVREDLGIPGTSVRTTWLCRDKPSMKEALRAAGVPESTDNSWQFDVDSDSFVPFTAAAQAELTGTSSLS